MPYLNLDLDYFTHPKVMRLARELGPSAVMYPIKLWCYAGKHFPVTGMLEACSKHDIEMAVGWDGEAGRLVNALVKLRFLDEVQARNERGQYDEKTFSERCDSNYKIHDWKQHAGHLWAFKKRAKTAAKKRWTEYASSIARSNAKGCAPNLSSPILTSSLHLQKDSEKKEEIGLALPPPKPKPILVNRGSVFPDGLQYEPRAEEMARGFGLNVQREFAAFRDFHVSKGTIFKDWQAAFRNWLRNAVKFSTKGAS